MQLASKWDVEIIKAGHIEILVTDLEAARRFYVDTLGFVVTESDRSHLYLRGLEERQHHSLVLSKDDSPGVGHIAFKVAKKGDLEVIKKLVKDGGGSVSKKDRGSENGVEDSVLLEDQFGFPVEFY